MTRPPNILLLVTDQERAPRHWPEDRGWLRELMPADAELRCTGLSFTHAYCNTAMCSPSRASLLTGLYPARHGVPLTLTAGDLWPDPRHAPAVTATMLRMLRRSGAPRSRLLKGYGRGLLRIGRGGDEPVLEPGVPTLAHVLRGAGYEVAYKGKWHLTRAASANGWGTADAERVARDHGFADWEPPDAGENARAENFGGGLAAWDEAYTSQAERWLARPELPEPFCLVVSLVNPHDVLGYPAQHAAGGYSPADFRHLGVGLPPTVDEVLAGKPAVHTLMQLGVTAYLGPLRDERARLDYVNFYAYLHQLVDRHLGRLLRALGDPDDPASLRSRTLIVRCADHGEMGLAHGGLRQKMFNVYEETVRVPFVVSNPMLFPRAAETDALAALVDVVPTLATVAGAARDGWQGHDLTPVLAERAGAGGERLRHSGIDFDPIVRHARPAPSVRSGVHFTYDDHQAGTALVEAPGQPNRVRAAIDGRRKYAVYVDPTGRRSAEHELYDLERDPDERVNLVDHRTGVVRDPADRGMRREMGELLDEMLARHGGGGR